MSSRVCKAPHTLHASFYWSSSFWATHHFSRLLSVKVMPDSVLLPSGTEPTKEEALELLNCFLDFISKHTANFNFWFLLFKARTLT